MWGVFYVVRGNDLVKLGITSGDPRVRFRTHRRQHGLSETLLVKAGLPAGDARWAETETLSVLTDLGAVPVKGREYFDDAWTDTILDTARWFL